MKKAVIIGANGFLGSSLVKRLLSENLEVIAIYNNNYENIDNRAIIIKKNVFNNYSGNIDYIYFLSGNYTNTYNEFISINYDLLKYTNKFKSAKFIYISSTNVYGNHNTEITESSCYNNPSLYGNFKLAGEFLISSLKNYSIIRLTYLYGPGITNSSFLPNIINSAISRSEIIITGSGKRFQDYLYIDDAVDLCYKCSLINENRIYLGATGKKISNNDAAFEIFKHIKCKIRYDGNDTSPSFIFNPIETFKFLNWLPQTSFEVGIEKMIKWYI